MAAQYPQAGVSDDGVLDTANANDDGTTGTNVTLSTGTADGRRTIEGVDIFADGVTTAGIIRFFVHDGTSAVLVGWVAVPPVTPVTTWPQIPNFQMDYKFPKPITLPSTSHTLKGNTLNSETFRVRAYGKTYV